MQELDLVKQFGWEELDSSPLIKEGVAIRLQKMRQERIREQQERFDDVRRVIHHFLLKAAQIVSKLLWYGLAYFIKYLTYAVVYLLLGIELSFKQVKRYFNKVKYPKHYRDHH